MPELTITTTLGAFRLAWPLVFVLLPLPWLFAAWSRRAPPLAAAIALPFAAALPVAAAAPVARPGLSFSRLLVFVLLLFAAARPQWISPADQRPASGRDLLLLLDVSASMKIRDLAAPSGRVSRLAAAARYGQAFLTRRPGDRAGLIVFASRPYLYVPLSYDLAAVGAGMAGAAVGLAGEKTALGDALGLATRTLSGEDGTSKAPAGAVAVLISDGANTAGALSPQQAAWLAAQRQVRVYTLGVGAAPNDEALRLIAEQTGGSFTRATDLAGVADFFRRLESLEPLRRSVEPAPAAGELYPLPLLLALLLALADRLRAAHLPGRGAAPERR